MYQALYRAYRPEVFDEILGQKHIVRILQNQIAKDEIGHAYLLCGTRGTGKTTTARILAKAVNCLSEGERPCGQCANCIAIKNGTFIDVIEIDAASNNGVENIRELRESVKYPPAAGRKKVYIIDEVHMLSQGAFNALLKTLEEPPEYVMFILATTEPQKLPATILSRCMRLDFRRVSENLLKQGMRSICEDKGIQVSEAALGLIAANADGSVRDGLSILDQCLAAGKDTLDREDVLDFLGTSSEEIFIELTHNVAVHNIAQALLILEQVLSEGKEIRQFMKDWLAHYRALLISKFVSSPEDMLNMSAENINRIKEQSQTLEVAEIDRAIIELSKTIADARWSTQPRVLLELCIVRLASVYEEPQIMYQQPARSEAPAVKAQPAPVQQTAPAEPEEAASVKAPVQQSSQPPADYDMIWRAVVEAASSRQGSFNLLRSGSRLTDISDGVFTVAAGSEFIRKLIQDSSSMFVELMEKQTGQRLTLDCTLGSKGRKQETDINSVVREAEDKLGLNIEIE